MLNHMNSSGPDRKMAEKSVVVRAQRTVLTSAPLLPQVSRHTAQELLTETLVALVVWQGTVFKILL